MRPAEEPGTTTQGRIETRPQAPVVVIGRRETFLDVQPTVREAENHLRHEQHSAGAAALDACDYYDGVARRLRPVADAGGGLTLELLPGDPEPEVLRARVNGVLASALASVHGSSLLAQHGVEEGELGPLPEEHSFARFLDELDRRFNDSPMRHMAGRLHNFWHALGG